MENVYANYRNIVERAVFAGIISEGNKQFYLSAIDEENGSDISELESRLNIEETQNQSCHLKQNDNFDPLLKSSYIENEESMKEVHSLLNKKHLEDWHSLLSEDSIENNSILDFKFSKNRVEAQETDSDTSSTKHVKKDSKSNRKLETARNLMRVMKKPRKNQIIDFDVPIYIDRNKKSVIKPHANDTTNLTQFDASNSCCCKQDNASIQGGKQSQNIRILTLPRVMQAEKSILTSEVNNLESCTKNNKSCHRNVEVTVDRFQDVSKSMKRKSVHTFSVQKESLDSCKIDPTMISKDPVDESNGRHCHCLHEIQTSSLQRLEAAAPIATQERKYRIRLKKPLNSTTRRQSIDTKKVSKVRHLNRAEKYEHCECDNVPKNLRYNPNDINLAESASEDKASSPDIHTKRNFQDNDCDRYLNVNIICQFYPESDEKRVVNGKEDPNIISDEPRAPKEDLKNEDVVKPAMETSKTRQSKAMHRLSKVFTNMKINRKQK